MLNCRACLWQCIRAIDATVPQNLPVRRNVTAALPYALRRRVAMRSYSDRPVQREAHEKEESQSRKDWEAGVHKQEKKSLTRAPAPHPKRDPSISTSDWNRRRKELQYLADPLELATFVKQELGKNRHEEMLQLVRMASRDMQCVVSWNHLIDYTLSQGKTAQALKIYNEMKKRAQFPDSYTYSILLKGLSENAHESGALAKALSVYHSMSADNARVEPNIIHTNAMLRVCARALDMDGLWGVAAKIPDRGPGAANGRTYATILNAIRQSLLVNVPLGETDVEVATRRERGVMEGRRVWEEIIGKWKSADLVIDEDLVCAMGRLLLVGARPRDWDDVLSLIEQTMDIPRLIPKLGTPERHAAGYKHVRAPGVPEKFKYDDDHLSPSKAPARGSEFLPLAPQGVKGLTSNLAYATPSNNTLSLVLEACQKIVGKEVGDHYWNLLTDPGTYNVFPDLNNVNMRLRILRQNRASKDAVKLLAEYFTEKGVTAGPGTFRLAMSTCVRDKNNHNSLTHASQILSMMMKTREDADAKTVIRYCELAISFPLKTGADLVSALKLLTPVTRSLRLQLGVGTGDVGNGKSRKPYLVGPDRQDAITAMNKIYAVHDKLINSELISEEEKGPYKKERAILAAFLQRLRFKDGGETGKKWEAVKERFGKEKVAEGEEEEAGKVVVRKEKSRPRNPDRERATKRAGKQEGSAARRSFRSPSDDAPVNDLSRNIWNAQF